MAVNTKIKEPPKIHPISIKGKYKQNVEFIQDEINNFLKKEIKNNRVYDMILTNKLTNKNKFKKGSVLL